MNAARRSLRAKITAAVLLAALLPFLVAVWLLARQSERDLRTAAASEAQSVGALARALAQERASRLLAVAQAIALTPDLPDALAVRDRATLLELSQPWLPRLGSTTVALTDERGLMVLRTYAPERFGDDVAATTKGLLPALRGDPTFSTEAAGLRGLAIRGFGPVTLNGRVVGVVAVTQNLDHEFLASLRATTGFETFAIFSDRTTVGDGPNAAAAAASIATGGIRTALAQFGGRWHAVHAWPLTDPDGLTVGHLGIVFPLDTLSEAQQRVRLTAVGAGLTAITGAGLLSWLLSRAAVAPVERMSRAARSIALGAAVPIPAVGGGDELEELSESLGSMLSTLTQQSHRLQEQTRHLEEQNARLDDARARAEALATEQTQLYSQMRESEARYRAVVEQSTDAIVLTEGTTIVYANDAYLAMIGVPLLEHVLGRPGDTWIHPDDRSLVNERTLARQRGEPVPSVYEFRIVRADAEIRTIEVAATSITRGGRPASLAILRDATERNRAEFEQRLLAGASAVLGSSLEYEATLAAVAHLLVREFAEWCTVYLLRDSTLERVAVAHADPHRGALLDQLSGQYPRRPEYPDPVMRVVQTGEPLLAPAVSPAALADHAYDVEHLRLLTTLDPRSAIIVPLVSRGESLGALGLNRSGASPSYRREDLALARQLADRCAAAIDNARLYAEARDAIRARDHFLAVAAHELRTPITGLKGTVQLLQRAHRRGAIDPARLERALDAIASSSNRLTALTDDLLDVGRLRTGHLELKPEHVDLSDLVRDLTRRFESSLSDRHQIRLDIPTAPPSATSVHLDPQRFEQVLVNLLDNAVKYSPAGGEVRVSIHPGDGGVAVSVTDSGIGLPPGAAQVIFEPFGRAANATAGNLPGMGLGLYVCRGIVEQHGGTIRAESPGEGQGTTITVWLPSGTVPA